MTNATTLVTTRKQFQLPHFITQILAYFRREKALHVDQQLARRLFAYIEADRRFDEAHDLSFFVHAGEVVVYGKMNSVEEADRLARVVYAIPGVVSVDLHVDTPAD